MIDQRLINQRERLINMLDDLDPTREEYRVVLDNINQLNWLTERNDEQVFTVTNKNVTAKQEPMDEPATHSVEPAVVEEPKKKVEEPASNEDASLSKEAVRDILSEAARNGIQIQTIISQFVPEGRPMKLSEVKAKDYPALVKAVQDAK